MQSRAFLFLLGAVAVIILLVTALDDGTARRSVLGLGLGLATALALWKPPSPKTFWYTIAGAALLSLALHVPFRLSYPATNDEGSILMDIHNVRSGVWPFRDTGGAKGPLGLLLLAPVVFATGNSLAAARVTVSLFTALEVVLLGVLGSRLWGARAGMLAAFLYAATPAAIAQTTQVFLQAFALPFATLALIVLLGNRKRGKQNFLAGALFGLAFLARSTTLAFAPVGLLLLLSETERPWRARLRNCAAALAGVFLTIAIASALVFPFLGLKKTLDFLGWQGVMVGQQRAALGRAAPGLSVLFAEPPAAQIRTLAQKAQPLLVGALPLLVLTAAFLVQRLGALLGSPKFVTAALLLALTFTVVPLLARQNLAPGNPAARPFVLWSSIALLPLAALSALRRPDQRGRPGRDFLLVGGTWLLLVIGYANYGRFRSHYHAEFLPLYVLAAAALLSESVTHALRTKDRHLALIARHLPGAGLFALAALPLVVAYPVVLRNPHAGNIPLKVAEDVAADLRSRTSPGEEIFTAQVLFPFLADRFVPFGISHSGWYREEALGILPTALRALYYPDRDDLRAYLEERPVRVIVIERRTREVYLEFDPALRALIERRYTLERTFQNPLVDSIEIWQRAAE